MGTACIGVKVEGALLVWSCGEAALHSVPVPIVLRDWSTKPLQHCCGHGSAFLPYSIPSHVSIIKGDCTTVLEPTVTHRESNYSSRRSTHPI